MSFRLQSGLWKSIGWRKSCVYITYVLICTCCVVRRLTVGPCRHWVSLLRRPPPSWRERWLAEVTASILCEQRAPLPLGPRALPAWHCGRRRLLFLPRACCRAVANAGIAVRGSCFRDSSLPLTTRSNAPPRCTGHHRGRIRSSEAIRGAAVKFPTNQLVAEPTIGSDSGQHKSACPPHLFSTDFLQLFRGLDSGSGALSEHLNTALGTLCAELFQQPCQTLHDSERQSCSPDPFSAHRMQTLFQPVWLNSTIMLVFFILPRRRFPTGPDVSRAPSSRAHHRARRANVLPRSPSRT